MDYILTTRALSKHYSHFKALNGLSMHVPKGSIYGFVGKNGAGKTTLIRLICGLQNPTSGDYSLYNISNGSSAILNARRRIGAVVETPSIYLNMTAEENLKQQYQILGLPSFDGIPDLLKLVGLENTGKKKAGQFSMGMKQRLGIAIALLNHPSLLILDEPTRGVDIGAKKEIYNIINDLAAKGVAIIMVSSELPEVLGMSDRIMVVREGSVRGIIGKEEANQENIMTLATGGAV